MAYTKRPEKWVDEVIEGHMKIICDEVLSSIPGVRSLVLTGGFAKGEGSAVIYPNKHQVFPVNDYDFYLITDHPIPLNTLVRTSKRATIRIGAPPFSLFSSTDHSFFVDLRCLPVGKLRHLPPLIRYLELKHVGRVLHGENLLSQIPDYKIVDIPIMDGIRTLFNRMGNLITYFSPRCIKNNTFDNRDFLIYSCHKSFTTCGTVLLLLSRQLKLSDTENMRLLRQIYHHFPRLRKALPDLPERIRFSTNSLLVPDFSKAERPVELWFSTRKYLGWTLRYCVSEILDEECYDEAWPQFSYRVNMKLGKNYLAPFLRELIKGYMRVRPNELLTTWASTLATLYLNFLQAYELRRQTGKAKVKPLLSARTPDLNLYSAIPLLLYSIDREANIDRKMLDLASEYLSRVYPAGRVHNDKLDEYWEALRDRFTLGLRLFLSSVVTKT
ncbi:MAG: hypothetical protein ACE5GD_00945 [Candidatus Geothermarchaeales archaeon]